MYGWISARDGNDLTPHLYADADFAGDRPGYKSTSGIFLCLAGECTCFPLSAKAARQSAVSHSTVEAEVVAANTAVRSIGIPQLELWEKLVKFGDVYEKI